MEDLEKTINDLIDIEANMIFYKHPESAKTVRKAIELLKERAPRKVKDIRNIAGMCLCGKCPSCGEVISNRLNSNFCGYCGDRLDWEEGEQE